MKWLSVVFALYIVMLNAMPLIGMADNGYDASCCATSCPITDLDEQPAENDDDGCNDVCNPFMSCSTCFGFTISSTDIGLETIVRLAEHNMLDCQSISLDHSYSIWHPPKCS